MLPAGLPFFSVPNDVDDRYIGFRNMTITGDKFFFMGLDTGLSLSSDTSWSFASSNQSSGEYHMPSDLVVQYDTVIKSFCPNILHSTLANSRELTCRSFEFKGACMLADISGFTRLSRLLEEKGGQGLDDLRRYTTRFLSKFIYIVYSFGGDGNVVDTC